MEREPLDAFDTAAVTRLKRHAACVGKRPGRAPQLTPSERPRRDRALHEGRLSDERIVHEPIRSAEPAQKSRPHQHEEEDREQGEEEPLGPDGSGEANKPEKSDAERSKPEERAGKLLPESPPRPREG